MLIVGSAGGSCAGPQAKREALADGAYVGPDLAAVTLEDSALEFAPVQPQVRVLDTREGEGPLTTGTPVTVDLATLVSDTTAAVSFNLTATGQTTSGYASVVPAGAAAGTSTLNWGSPPGTVANGHIVKLSENRELEVQVTSAGSAHLVLDITGCFVSPEAPGASVFTGVERRVYDSRLADGPLLPGTSRRIPTGNGTAPAVAPSAAAVNVTVTDTTGSGYVTLAGAEEGATSSVNWSGDRQTVANAVITAVAPDGAVTVTNPSATGTANVILDLTGTFAPTSEGATGAQFHPVDPVRAYDSRSAAGPLLAGESRLNELPVPDDAVAVAVNTTITGTRGRGFLSVTRPVFSTPSTSTLNWYTSPTTRANGSVITTDGDSARTYVGGTDSTQYVLDLSGYFR